MYKARRRAWMMPLLLMSLSVTGCVAPARVGIEYCDHARPVYFADLGQVDATPADIRRQIRDGNAIWHALCAER